MIETIGALGAVCVLISVFASLIFFCVICGIYSRAGDTNRLLAKLVAQQDVRGEMTSVRRNLGLEQYAADQVLAEKVEATRRAEHLARMEWAKIVAGVGFAILALIVLYAAFAGHK